MNKNAYSAALRRLGVREYSAFELDAYLERKEFSAEDRAEVIAELQRQQYLDDARFMRAMVRAQASRGKGPAVIRMKLRQKGVDASPAIVKTVLAEVCDQSDLERAREIVGRRYPNFKNDKATAAKAFAALVRRGFAFDIARQAISARDLE